MNERKGLKRECKNSKDSVRTPSDVRRDLQGLRCIYRNRSFRGVDEALRKSAHQ